MMRVSAQISVVLLFAAAALAGGCTQTIGTSNVPESPFTAMPDGDENPDWVFLDADEAFQTSQFAAAARHFGTLFIVAPDYRGTAPVDGLTLTCQNLQTDCRWFFGRLEFMRDAFYGRWGERSRWVPAQQQDFQAILTCYERGAQGDWQGARGIGARVINAPDPGFAEYARRCVGFADDAIAAAERQRRADQALLVWFDFQPCMDQNRVLLMDAFDATDWETFVGIYPQYQTCAAELQRIIDEGVLQGDPRLGMEHDIAWSNMSEVDAIMLDYEDEYSRTRDALIELESDPRYSQLLVQWDSLDFEEQRVRNEIGSLQRAADSLSGATRDSVMAQLAAKQAELQSIIDAKDDVVDDINRMRRDLGLATLQIN